MFGFRFLINEKGFETLVNKLLSPNGGCGKSVALEIPPTHKKTSMTLLPSRLMG
jgi:hypothetical protein